MKTKHTTKQTQSRYSFTTGTEGKDHWYQVMGDGFRLLEGGYGRSRRDAAECARAAIRQLEAGTHYTQRQATPNPDWQDCIPANPGWTPLPMTTVDPDYFPF